jgi:hypothetical protein
MTTGLIVSTIAVRRQGSRQGVIQTPPFGLWRKEIHDETLTGPRMVIGSPIVDGPRPIWPNSIAVSNEIEARQVVERFKRNGYDFVKVYSALPRQAYFAIADESRKSGIPFAGHVPEAVSVVEASDAGQKSIEHLTGVLISCSTREEELRKARAEAYLNLPPGQRLPGPARLRPLNRATLETFSSEKAKHCLRTSSEITRGNARLLQFCAAPPS